MLDPVFARARVDENVVGLVVHGSRARSGAHVRDDSDWDLVVVVREPRGEWSHKRGEPVEYAEISLARLPDVPDWFKPALLWAEPLLDKTGEVAVARVGAPRAPLPVEVDLARLDRIARSASLSDQQELFRETESLARSLGLGATIDGWEPDVAWLRGD